MSQKALYTQTSSSALSSRFSRRCLCLVFCIGEKKRGLWGREDWRCSASQAVLVFFKELIDFLMSSGRSIFLLLMAITDEAKAIDAISAMAMKLDGSAIELFAGGPQPARVITEAMLLELSGSNSSLKTLASLCTRALLVVNVTAIDTVTDSPGIREPTVQSAGREGSPGTPQLHEPLLDVVLLMDRTRTPFTTILVSL
jgi:hypothetical protein